MCLCWFWMVCTLTNFIEADWKAERLAVRSSFWWPEAARSWNKQGHCKLPQDGHAVSRPTTAERHGLMWKKVTYMSLQCSPCWTTCYFFFWLRGMVLRFQIFLKYIKKATMRMDRGSRCWTFMVDRGRPLLLGLRACLIYCLTYHTFSNFFLFKVSFSIRTINFRQSIAQLILSSRLKMTTNCY